MKENQRDSGLLRAVGPFGLAASIVNVVIGAGIFAVPGVLASCAGVYAPLVFLVCALMVGAVAICFAEGGSRIPTSGGAYGYIAGAFGPLAGYVAGTLLWVGDVLACGGVAAALAGVATSLAPPQFAALVRPVVIVGTIGGMALVNIRGVAGAARFVSAATMIKLVPLAVFVIVGASAVHASNFIQTVVPTTEGLSRALILAMFAAQGMEVSLCVSGEVSRPNRTIPRALLIALFLITLAYVAIQVVAQGILGASLAQSTVPLADAMARVSPSLRGLMIVGAAVSMFGWMGSSLFGSPRVLFAFGRDGLLPSVLGRVHPRTRAPHVAILSYAAIAIGLALSGTFAELAILSALTSAGMYIMGCAAAWRLARSGVALAGEPLNYRWLGSAAVIGIASMAALIALATRAEMIGLAALIGASVVVYMLQTQAARLRR
jgi:APA family basic amino acid/polyamine antiporter